MKNSRIDGDGQAASPKNRSRSLDPDNIKGFSSDDALPFNSYEKIGLSDLENRQDTSLHQITLTPEIVERLIATVDRYESRVGHSIRRALKLHRVATWKQMHIDNQFMLLGDSIKLSDPRETGEIVLLDGWHRANLVIETQKALRCYSQPYVPLELLPYIDAGHSRSASDNLAISGCVNAARLAVMAALIYLFEHKISYASTASPARGAILRSRGSFGRS